jgi:hypothetical protein
MPEEQETPARILVRALEGLEPEERSRVLAWMFDRLPQTVAPTASALTPGLQKGLAHRWGEFAAAEASLLAGWGDIARRDMRMVPVRIPVDQHARLQEWCKEHGFSMATVVRGLLARFLDDQGQPPREAAG